MALAFPVLLPVFLAFGGLLIAVPLIALVVFVFGGHGASGDTESSEAAEPER